MYNVHCFRVDDLDISDEVQLHTLILHTASYHNYSLLRSPVSAPIQGRIWKITTLFSLSRIGMRSIWETNNCALCYTNFTILFLLTAVSDVGQAILIANLLIHSNRNHTVILQSKNVFHSKEVVFIQKLIGVYMRWYCQCHANNPATKYNSRDDENYFVMRVWQRSLFSQSKCVCVRACVPSRTWPMLIIKMAF